MDEFLLRNDVHVFGIEVETFPDGIGEAFDALVNLLPGRYDRSFYGICFLNEEGSMVYISAAEEIEEGEAEKYNCQRFTIKKGEYFSVRLRDWRKNTDSIKGIFEDMMQDSRVNKRSPSIEWYKNDEEMFCMLKKL